MSNPFEPSASAPPPSDDADRRSASRQTAGPGITLMVMSGIWTVFLLVGFASNVLLLATGASEVLDDPMNGAMSKETQITVRMTLGVLFMVLNGFIFYGANELRRVGNQQVARIACILALIPCVGPCYLLGIPFGIWGLVVLAKPQVQEAFADRW